MRFHCLKTGTPISPQAWLCLHSGSGVACLMVADWLFYGHTIGISFAVYILFLALVSAGINPPRAARKERRLGLIILSMGIFPLIYDFNFLSCCFGVIGLVCFCQRRSGMRYGSWKARIQEG